MKHFSVALVAAVALFAITLAADADLVPPTDEVLQDQQQVSSLRYITCDGTSWSCEDCNTRKLCVEFWWSTFVYYFQCPQLTPYCDSSSPLALCTAKGSAGCTGNTTDSG